MKNRSAERWPLAVALHPPKQNTMKKISALWTIPIWLCLNTLVDAQEKGPAPAVEKIKNVETGNVEGTKRSAPSVNKADGINTINGVKADGRTAVPPVNPVVPPPVAGTAAKVETGSATGTTSSAKGVNKVDGIDTINGVKTDGRTNVPPVNPVAPPPVAGTAAKVETGSATGTTSSAKGVNKVDGIDTINGVKTDGRTNVPPMNPVAPPPVAGTAAKVETGSATGTTSSAKGVNKVDGIDTINGVKADGRTTVPPPRAVPPPVIPAGSAVTVGGGSVGTAASIQAVVGVTGINAAKLQNLEAALKLKHEGTHDGGGKAKAAAALLGAPGPGTKPGPKADGRAGFQEFEKLPDTGS